MMKLLVINGFDRSGSSFIGGLLSQHPQVNYYFQPFSSTWIHKTQFEVWDRHFSAPAPEKFLHDLQAGSVDREYPESDWFDRYSNYEINGTKSIALIKETKLHTKIGWLKAAFPEAMVYGIWRDPRAILFSLVRNRFHLKWYGGESFEQVSRLIRSEPRLGGFVEFLQRPLSAEARMALIVAVRTRIMASELEQKEWLIYERIAEEPNAGLQQLCARLGLSDYDFSSLTGKDYNVIGLPFRNRDMWKQHLPQRLVAEVQPIFDSIQYEINVA